MTTADLDTFARRVLAFHAARGPATPRWALDVARRSESPVCAFCTAPWTWTVAIRGGSHRSFR